MSYITNCPMCESKAEVFATGCSEYYGWAVQRYGVKCTDEFNKHCDMEVSVDADFSYLDWHDNLAIELWNTVCKHSRNPG